jgi:hypothetical protein
MADVFNVDDVGNQTFYGFRLNADTGRLTLEKINDGVTPVRLPDDVLIREGDYKHWLWTRSTLTFSWNSNDKTRLLVEVL